MLRVNIKDGSTRSYDLLDRDGKAAWLRDRSDAAFQRSISGIGIARNGSSVFLPAPTDFDRLFFDAEVIYDASGNAVAARLACAANGVTVSGIVYLNSKMLRIDLNSGRNTRWTSTDPEAAPGRKGA